MHSKKEKLVSLQDAVSLICSGRTYSELTVEYLDAHEEDLKKASKKLILGIAAQKIRVFGHKRMVPMEKGEQIWIAEHPYKTKGEQIFGLGRNMQLRLTSNAIQHGYYAYYNVTVCLDDLKKQFSIISMVDELPMSNNYTTPYLALMFEVIQEEGISVENQSKKELLTDCFAKKMSQRGLRPSANLAKAMATLIRLPGSQNGRNRKG